MSLKQNTLSFLDRFEIHKKLPYSDQTILVDKTNSQFLLMKQIIAEAASQLKQAVESLESQRSLPSPHLLQLIDYHIKPVVKQSRTSHKIITFYEYSGYDLLEETRSRASKNRFFDENQLWNILCSVVMGLAHLEKAEIGHGCVSLLDIFITSDGSLKIVDPSISSVSPSDYSDGYYYSPQMFEFFANPQIQPQQVDIYRSDVFSLALCMVHIATLDELDRCMDYDNYCIDFDELEDKIRVLNEHYSQQFVNVLVHMLNEIPEQRPNFVELEEYLISFINQKDGIYRGNVTLSMHFQNLNNAHFHKNNEAQLVSPILPEQEDVINGRQGIPLTTMDNYNIDVNVNTSVKNSIKITQQKKPNQILLIESLSYNNTSRNNIEKKMTQQIEAIVFKKLEAKQNERPRVSLLSDLSSYVSTSKDNLPVIVDLFPVNQSNKDTSEVSFIKFQEKQQKKVSTVNPSKGVSRKWNVVKQPPKHDNKAKGFIQQELQNQRNKINSTQIRTKKPLSEQSKMIKRAKPVTKSPRATTITPNK